MIFNTARQLVFYNLLFCLLVILVQCGTISLAESLSNKKLVAQGDYQTFDDIFIGRCTEFQETVFPELFKVKRVNCRRVLQLFRNATVLAMQQASHNCTTNPQFYEQVVQELDHPVPPGARFLLYSRVTYDFVRAISDGGRRFYFMGNTLRGYLLNGLSWCNTPDFPFPERKNCTCFSSEVELAYWIRASAMFVQSIKGQVHIALNGSNPNDVAFSPTSVLRITELPLALSKPPGEISGFTVLLSQNIDARRHKENCSASSVKELETIVKSKKFSYDCVNDPDIMRHEMCKDATQLTRRCQFVHSAGYLTKIHFPLLVHSLLFGVFRVIL
jgi:hypothetical protein